MIRPKDGFTMVFSRIWKLNFKNTVVFIAQGVGSLQRELVSFYKVKIVVAASVTQLDNAIACLVQ